MKNWVSEIRNAAYDAEDIIDTFIQNEETKGFLHRTFKNWINLYQVAMKFKPSKIGSRTSLKAGKLMG